MNAAGYARKSPRRPLLFAHRFADGKASRGDAKVPLRLRLPHFPTLSEREDTSPGFVSSSIALQTVKYLPSCTAPARLSKPRSALSPFAVPRMTLQAAKGSCASGCLILRCSPDREAPCRASWAVQTIKKGRLQP